MYDVGVFVKFWGLERFVLVRRGNYVGDIDRGVFICGIVEVFFDEFVIGSRYYKWVVLD